MIINGKEFDFDIADVDNMERYEKALHDMQDTAKNAKKGLSTVENARLICKGARDFFDTVLGDGKSKDIFGEKDNVRTAYDVLEKFIEDCSKEYESINNRFNKYSSNRAQRRQQ